MVRVRPQCREDVDAGGADPGAGVHAGAALPVDEVEGLLPQLAAESASAHVGMHPHADAAESVLSRQGRSTVPSPTTRSPSRATNIASIGRESVPSCRRGQQVGPGLRWEVQPVCLPRWR